jgi:hypothetical protein
MRRSRSSCERVAVGRSGATGHATALGRARARATVPLHLTRVQGGARLTRAGHQRVALSGSGGSGRARRVPSHMRNMQERHRAHVMAGGGRGVHCSQNRPRSSRQGGAVTWEQHSLFEPEGPPSGSSAPDLEAPPCSGAPRGPTRRPR